MRKNEEKIAIYSRKSKFTGKGESIGNQIELCKDYVRNMFGERYVELCEVFEDEGFSGGNLKRPAFQRMMADVRKRKFKAIVVYRLDRISRNISDFTGLIDELTKLDVSFVSIREQFDTSTPMGRAMMFIISVFSQLERETIAERIRDNMHRSLAWWNCAVGVSVETCEQNHDRRQREKILLLGACAGRNRHSETDLRFVYAIGFSDSRGGRASPQKNQDKAGKELFTLCNQGNPSKSCVHGGR